MPLLLVPRPPATHSLPAPPRQLKVDAVALRTHRITQIVVMPLCLGFCLYPLIVLCARIPELLEMKGVPLPGVAVSVLFWLVTSGGVLMAYAGGWFSEPYWTRQIFTHGRETTAHVVKKTTEDDESGPSFHVTYEYEDAAGHRHRCEHRNVAAEIWTPLQISDPITILYHPQLCSRSRVAALCDYILPSEAEPTTELVGARQRQALGRPNTGASLGVELQPSSTGVPAE